MEKIKLPIVVVNFKTYETSTGNESLKLAKICEKVSIETGKSVAICVSATDIYKISDNVKIPVFAQHVDPEDFGAHTGKILVSDIKDNGAYGSLLNHSEDRYRLDVLEEAIRKLHDNNLVSIVCANNDESAEAISTFDPDIIAVEPPELIGGNVSVTSADPSIVKITVEKVHKINKEISILCGAGIKNGEDVKAAIDLGCQGVLVASGVTKAIDPENALKDLLNGI
jgi:triosephosphate isomerase